jgi:hypothetical protein
MFSSLTYTQVSRSIPLSLVQKQAKRCFELQEIQRCHGVPINRSDKPGSKQRFGLNLMGFCRSRFADNPFSRPMFFRWVMKKHWSRNDKPGTTAS